MDMKRMALFFGGLLLAVGLLLGFVPVSAGGVSCGSAYAASDDAGVADYVTVLSGGSLRDANAESSCKDALSTWRGFSTALAIPGGLVALGGLISLGFVREPA